ncbi:uncharacterized protein LOC129918818 [Episyrphus balteatus]|uniref:uncharacterized protein LOC129918818 n=1 Tax=Episyrphus balteatus TaxID=286459 RepID=UPI002486CA94|nr:uncharacterized protein LOC129918818 [Episyrphus balteatus]
MFRRTFKVTFRPMRNNFIALPENYYELVSTYDKGCISLTYGKYCHYAMWMPHAGTVKDTEIGINARVAKEMGLKENDLVKCALVDDVQLLKSVHVTPVSSKDWEIIELSSEKLQDSVLEQTKIINSTQFLVVWVNKSMQVTLTVDRIRPNINFGRINHTTELVVTPKVENITNGLTETNGDSHTNGLHKSQTMSSVASSDTGLSRSTTVSNIKSLTRKESVVNRLSMVNRLEKMRRLIRDLKRENTRTFEFRAISGTWEDTTQISDIFVTKNNLPEFMDLDQVYCLRTAEDGEYYVTVKVVAEGQNFPNNIHQTIEINENLMQLLKMRELEKITLTPKHMVLNFVEKIELYSHKKTHYKIVEGAFKRFIADKTKLSPLLLNQDEVIKLDEGMIVTILISPEHFRYCLVDSQLLKECKIYAADLIKNAGDVLEVDAKEDTILSVKDLIKLPEFDDIVVQLVDQLKMNLCLDQRNSVLRQGNILVAGQTGCGKSVIVERVLDELVKKPYSCSYDIFYSTRSKGRKTESIQKDLREIFTTCLQNAPAIVVLENLDVLAHSTGDQPTQDSEYYNRIADIVQHLIVEYTATNPISVIATVSSLKKLNRRLYSPRGRHLFQTIAKVPTLGRLGREMILKELCNHIDSEKLDLARFGNLTEGYNKGDLVQFVERAIFYAYRMSKTNPILTNDHLAKSLESTNSYCLQGITSNNKPTDTIMDVGMKVEQIPGLEAVVTVLEEVLVWPTIYPKIFSDSPLRNQAGVLLFGPPGTGKTYLVSQIANSWNLRTISVKGPELLAKYIGQSEENVRNLFSRARSAKPCVLFFDEFDSLAPKRGHDSTGVTDRVVNQLLTELDGVEGLQGVTVIAATSRPELLDPALLRSGRIDRLVECPLPDTAARLSIFKTLSQTLFLDKNVDLARLASKTQNYTGADIQSILTSANMAAVKEVLEKCGHQNLPDKIIVTHEHLIEAYKTTRPSLSPSDVSRYRHTYERFTNKEKSSREFVAKRATLA